MATPSDGFGKNHSHDCISNGFILGIDIGTTTIKAALLKYITKQKVARQTIEHCAQNESEMTGHFQRREQHAEKIFVALNKCIKQLPDDVLKDVKDIVICGQMHGCVLWNREKLLALKGLDMERKLRQIGNFVSTLITWEDGRCSSDFLSSLPKAKAPIASGYGCASLFWLQKHTPEILERYNCAGTIMDLVVTCLCASCNCKVYMSSQNACSWGYYDVENGKWELEKYVEK